MKRYASLIQLSHDHHDGLVHARRLAKSAALPSTAAIATAQEFLAWVGATLAPHLAIEERLLADIAPSVAAASAETFATQRDRMLAEHAALRAHCAALEQELLLGAPSPQQVIKLGELLRDHIRFEERELFGTVQESVPEPILTAAVAKAESPTR